MSNHFDRFSELDTLLGDLRDGTLDDEKLRRLDVILAEDADAVEYYAEFIDLFCSLSREPAVWENEEQRANDECGTIVDARGRADSVLDAGTAPLFSIDDSFVAPIHHSSFSVDHSVLPSSFIGGVLFSYLTAALLLGAALTIAWAWRLPNAAQYAGPSVPHASPLSPSSDMQFVGQVTGMVDCQWADATTAALDRSHIPLGRKYALASGLMEITYYSGAKVVLQGPCTYEVDAAAGGYLSVGKLVARVNKNAECRMMNDELRTPPPDVLHSSDPKSQIPNHQISNPQSLFAVRTPTAVVTDLGTEFGVEVDGDGNQDIQVFEGRVNVRVPSGKDGSWREMELKADEAVRFDATLQGVVRRAEASSQFTRRIARPSASQVISINFLHGGKSVLEPGERTGVVRASHWNNVDGEPVPPPVVDLHDAAGDKTTAQITWQWTYHEATLPHRTWFNSYPNQPSPHAFDRLFDGHFNGVSADAQGRLTPDDQVSLAIHVHGIPYSRYRVYVYYWIVPSDDPKLMHTFGLSVNGSDPLVISRSRSWLNDFYRYQSEVRPGNYEVFENLSGDLQITATPDGPGPHHNLFIAGFQIVGLAP